MIKFELDLCIPMTYLHMHFQPHTYISTKVREQKLKISSRGIILSKIIGPYQIRTWPVYSYDISTYQRGSPTKGQNRPDKMGKIEVLTNYFLHER
jgi:hypothetical protein